MEPKKYSEEAAQPLGKGKICAAGALTDSALLSQLQGYRRMVAGNYQSLLPEDVPVHIHKELMYVSPKIDGEIWFLIYDGDEVFLCSPAGKIIFGDIPLLQEARKYSSRFDEFTAIAGELYALRKEGRSRVGDVSAALSGGADAEVEKLGFAVFDLACAGDGYEPCREAYDEKLERMEELFEGGKRVRLVPTEELHTPEQVLEFYKEWVESGKAEGLVCRSSGRNSKIKPSFTLDAVIIGYTERAEDAGQIRSLALALMRPDGQFQYISACGNMNSETRESLMKLLQGDLVDSNWRLTRGDGAMFRFVKPKYVVEVKATDVVDQDSSGDAVKQMVLQYDEKRGWQALRKLPAPSLLFPVFVRIRDDKRINEHDIRIAQVLERCYVPQLEIKAENKSMPASEVQFREVYTKSSKKGMAVRKFIMWATHKKETDSRFPNYVVQYTDYSPGRKEPLKREVRRAETPEMAKHIIQGMLEANVKKGWVLAE
jgi:hypothetical protein